MLFVTGDTHGEQGRFQYEKSAIERTLKFGDKLIVCGDFGYVFWGDEREEKFLEYLAEKPYQILFVDGNHENFDLLEKISVEQWCGGKVHVVKRDKENNPKVIHLMRGQVFTIEGKKIFTFGGACSIDKYMRTPQYSWWSQEMPTDNAFKEAILNLEAHNNQVDYIVTHTAPKDTMSMFHLEEQPLNNFLEWIRENVQYKYWWFGHLHMDEDLWRHQACLWFQLRNMETNEVIDEV